MHSGGDRRSSVATGVTAQHLIWKPKVPSESGTASASGDRYQGAGGRDKIAALANRTKAELQLTAGS